MLNHRVDRRCFIIGPMKDADQRGRSRLARLKNRVIIPLLNKISAEDNYQTHYIVETPYDIAHSTNIMNSVIYAIDRADIIIADLTDSNPNVFYELGITHALGRPSISVLENTQKSTEFDISAYFFYHIALDNDTDADYQLSMDTLEKPLRNAHKDVDWSRFQNPVIDFYRAPITFISPAYALALGYYNNFVRPVVESMILKRGRDNYDFEINIAEKGDPRVVSIDDTEALSIETRNRLKLHIIVPQEISFSQRNYADRFRYQIDGAIIEGRGRNYTCFYRADSPSNAYELIDLPTTMSSMEDAISRRLVSDQRNKESEEWKAIERQEVDRFVLNLEILINAHSMNPEFKNAIRISRFNPQINDPQLRWVSEILL